MLSYDCVQLYRLGDKAWGNLTESRKQSQRRVDTKLIEKDGPLPFQEQKQGGSTKFVVDVYSVDLRVNPRGGHTRTGVWHDVRLEPRIYVKPPEDGIWNFAFVGDPTGAVLDVMAPVSGDYVWNKFPQDLKGVRVIAETDVIEKRFETVFALAS